MPAQIRSLCRAYTDEAVRSLAAIMRQADAPPGARIQAIAILLDRGWGKPPQPHTGEYDKDIRINVRKSPRAAISIDVDVRHSTAGAGRRTAAPVAAIDRHTAICPDPPRAASLFVPYFGRRSCRVSISVSDVRLTEATARRRVEVSSINPPARGERERAR